MAECPSCGFDLEPAHRFCPLCATPRPATQANPLRPASMATGGGKRCGRCEAPLRGRPQCPRCGTLNQGVAQPSGRPPVLGATPAQPSPPPPPPQPARLTLGQKLHARLRTAAFLFVGLVWVIGGIGFTISPLGGAWGLLGTLYGFYVLSGLLTGGSRFLLY